MALTISSIQEAAGHLKAQIASGQDVLTVRRGAALDAAGAQLLASAALAISARGGTPAIEFADNGDALKLWKRLGLEQLFETRIADPAPEGEER